MNPPRILVVDDERFNLELIVECLDGHGFEIKLADDGDVAWELLSDPSEIFDLVVLDRMMPHMGGMEVLRCIKGSTRLRDLPVIMQTAAAGPDQVREGLEAGAYYYLTKPFEPDALLAIVRSALEDAEERAHLVKEAQSQRRIMRKLAAAEFRIRTLDEATDLAALIALTAPVPEAAVMGLSELLVNAVEHGNLSISYKEKARLKREDGWREEVERRLSMPQYRDREVHVRIEHVDGEVVYTITDQGEGFDHRRYLEFDPERAFDPNGRGIAMARQLSFRRLEYQGKGNVVVASIAVDGRATEGKGDAFA